MKLDQHRDGFIMYSFRGANVMRGASLYVLIFAQVHQLLLPLPHAARRGRGLRAQVPGLGLGRLQDGVRLVTGVELEAPRPLRCEALEIRRCILDALEGRRRARASSTKGPNWSRRKDTGTYYVYVYAEEATTVTFDVSRGSTSKKITRSGKGGRPLTTHDS